MKLSASLSKIRTAMGGFVLTSLMVGFLCISFVHNISAHAGMGMSHSIHNTSSATVKSCCDAGVYDHMELWKSTLVGIPQSIQYPLALFIAITFVGAFTFSELFGTQRIDIHLFALRYRQYVRHHPDSKTFNPLLLAFSNGILNPKLY